jgi:hypothetical protein
LHPPPTPPTLRLPAFYIPWMLSWQSHLFQFISLAQGSWLLKTIQHLILWEIKEIKTESEEQLLPRKISNLHGIIYTYVSQKFTQQNTSDLDFQIYTLLCYTRSIKCRIKSSQRIYRFYKLGVRLSETM